MTIVSSYGQRCVEETNRDIGWRNGLNQIQPVYIRDLSEYEKEQIFGDNPDYIKNIGRNDGEEWKELIKRE